MRMIHKRKYLCSFIIVAFIIAYGILLKYKEFYSLYMDKESISQNCSLSRSRRNDKGSRVKNIRISWYILPAFLTSRPDAMFVGFNDCSFSNCKLSFVHSDAAYSDAVIFTGRLMPKTLPFTRPSGQIWIFYEHEPPYRYEELSNNWNQSNTFNWTMTYDRTVSDIHLPYGEIINKTKIANKDFDKIMQRKKRTALLIVSHCRTPSDRLTYIKELQKYVDVDVIGNCGVKWDCGRRFVHDDCFEEINSYKFYLAFENSFCNNYFTEKIFDNFDFDSVLVSRGGTRGEIKQILPDGTYISTDDFKTVKDLGMYLRSMSDETYINILKKKQLYTSYDSYTRMFRNAMCNICKRMNNIDKFKKIIKDMDKWAYNPYPCIPPSDILK